jgi:DNA-directed RNA polymerase subunit RPC12/RpoP
MPQSADGILVIVAAFALTAVVQGVVNRTVDYECPSCGARFSPSAAGAVLTPHMLGRRLMRCPACGVVGWASMVPKGR